MPLLQRLPTLGPGLIPAAAARQCGARELCSEDFNHGQDYGGVRVVNPFLPASG